jgi:hypothetical protein
MNLFTYAPLPRLVLPEVLPEVSYESAYLFLVEQCIVVAIATQDRGTGLAWPAHCSQLRRGLCTLCTLCIALRVSEIAEHALSKLTKLCHHPFIALFALYSASEAMAPLVPVGCRRNVDTSASFWLYGYLNNSICMLCPILPPSLQHGEFNQHGDVRVYSPQFARFVCCLACLAVAFTSRLMYPISTCPSSVALVE